MVSHLSRHGKISRGAKLLGMTLLHKHQNNFCEMKLFQKNRAGVPSRIT
jgi:hypothetical protein